MTTTWMSKAHRLMDTWQQWPKVELPRRLSPTQLKPPSREKKVSQTIERLSPIFLLSNLLLAYCDDLE